MEKIIFPGLVELLQSSKDIHLLDSWDTIIKILGTHLHNKISKLVCSQIDRMPKKIYNYLITSIM